MRGLEPMKWVSQLNQGKNQLVSFDLICKNQLRWFTSLPSHVDPRQIDQMSNQIVCGKPIEPAEPP